MAGDTATLSLEGIVDLATFSSALENFRMLLDGLAETLATGYHIDWEITGLRNGSAVTVVRGIANNREAVLSVTTALDVVGEALQSRKAIPYGSNVTLAVRNLTQLVDGRVRAVRLVTAEREYILAGSPTTDAAKERRPELVSAPRISPTGAYGAVEGEVRTLSLTARGRPRFNLYDESGNRVTCYMEEGQHDEVAAQWGRRVVVEGWVQRDGSSGLPLSIRHITAITPVPEAEPPAWQGARGSVPRKTDTSRAEDVIRGLRDV
jgi:hypothetical protein